MSVLCKPSNGHMYVYTNSSAWVGYDTRSVSKRDLGGLNSEFSFSLVGCHIDFKEPSLPYYLLHSLERSAGGISIHMIADKTEYMCFNQRGNIFPYQMVAHWI